MVEPENTHKHITLIHKQDNRFSLVKDDYETEPFALPEFFETADDCQDFLSSHQPKSQHIFDSIILTYDVPVLQKSVPLIFELRPHKKETIEEMNTEVSYEDFLQAKRKT
jgi:hypothetical protein